MRFWALLCVALDFIKATVTVHISKLVRVLHGSHASRSKNRAELDAVIRPAARAVCRNSELSSVSLRVL